MRTTPDRPDACTFCERPLPTDGDDPVHRVCSRRVDRGTDAVAQTERVACEHCFADVATLTADMTAHTAHDLDAAVAYDCSRCGDELAGDASVERLDVDDDRYLLCADCTGFFDECCRTVPGRDPAGPAVGGQEPGATAEVVTDGGAPDEDPIDLGTVLDSGLDDVEVDDRIAFTVRADTSGATSDTVDTVRGDVTRAETSYIGGSTVYVDGDDGEEYRLESSFSSEAVRVTTVHGHDLRFQGHLDELRVDR
ncbi:hypothetical protein [Haloarchaeobius sp. HRN-SO-5]|uniref:hypothetical protein n=1 Tax=Haloarchaeobius sp. HRN-SO-5 TaxID=3446118 RepID=UPI003EB71266